MPELYRACDVYCQPSLVEPQGQAILEALASGRPVVATRVGGPPEYVTDACGILVDPLDVAAVAEGMRAAAELPVPCPAAAEVARRHSIARSAQLVEQLLVEVTSGGDG
jgi:glycosyltransferase involved in cell wall biosynthesis